MLVYILYIFVYIQYVFLAFVQFIAIKISYYFQNLCPISHANNFITHSIAQFPPAHICTDSTLMVQFLNQQKNVVERHL